jgi:hypothetical protein
MICVALLVLLPTASWANAGTPLMWAGMLHLSLGNAIIGVIEGLLMARIFACPVARSIAVMIAANYISAIFGWGFLLKYLCHLPDITLENLHLWFATFAALAFLISVIIEGPFYALVLPAAARTWRRTLKATCVINSMSYMLLAAWYWLASGGTIMTSLEVVTPRSIAEVPGFAMVYISQDRQCIIATDLSGEHPATLGTIHAGANDRLGALLNKDGSCALTLINTWHHMVDDKAPAIVLTIPDLNNPTSAFLAGARPGVASEGWNTVSFAPASSWNVYEGFWAMEGIRGENQQTHERFRFGLETPFVQWHVRSVTQVSDHLIIFQLGADQICALDPLSRRIAIVARGQGPVVLAVPSK